MVALLVVLGLAAWALVHGSGVHATAVSGVLMAPRCRSIPSTGRPPAVAGTPAPVLCRLVRARFALMADGRRADRGRVWRALHRPREPGGGGGAGRRQVRRRLGGTWLTARFTLHGWTTAVLERRPGCLAARGHRLHGEPAVGELAFGEGSERDQHVKLGVLTGSMLASALGTAVLRRRDAVYRRIGEQEASTWPGAGGPDGQRSSCVVTPWLARPSRSPRSPTLAGWR